MRTVSKQPIDVMRAYQVYWESYLKGDMETMFSLMDDDFKVIGSSEGEVFYNKKEAMAFYGPAADQIAGISEMRNRQIKKDEIDGLALITEACDFYILVQGKWTFYSKVRLSSFLRNKGNGWKFVHQHGSMPDSRADEGERADIEKIKNENIELRDAIKRRTVELENKNRELEIEAALERVRAVAMGMNRHEDLLQICESSFFELKKLGFESLRNVVIHIPNDEQNYFMDYDFSDFTGGQIGKVAYGMHPIVDEYLEKIRSSEDAFFEVVIDEDMLEDWNEFRRKSGQMYDQRLETANAVYYYVFSIGIGDIGISTFKAISDSQIKTLKKFRNVFSLTYKRYSDITLAETQAREAKIEAALEKVRSSTLAMKQPEDMVEVCRIISDQLQLFSIKDIRHIQTVIIDDLKGTYLNYEYFTQYKTTNILEVEIKLHPVIEEFARKITKSKDTFFTKSFEGEALKNWIRYRKETKQNEDTILEKAQSVHYYFYSIGPGALGVSTYAPLNEEDIAVFKRFHKVFALAYRRFTDIEQTIARAREAQIEAALERIRARSIAMHKSEELADLSLELVKQVQALGVSTWFCAFNIYDNDPRGSLEWGSNGEGTFPKYRTPREGIFLRYYEAGQKGETLLIHEIGENECPAHYAYLCTLPGVGEQLLKMKDAGIPFPTSQIDHVAYFKYGYIIYITYEPVPESHDIFKRFAKIFEQTYARFLDLQKAEALAREAEIQLALERVRARTMAMQKSNELAQTAANLFKQMESLAIKPYRCNIVIVDAGHKKIKIWSTTNNGNVIPLGSDIPFNENSVFKKMLEGWKKQKAHHTIKLVGQDRVNWTKFIRQYVPLDEYKPENLNKSKLMKEAAVFNNFYFRQGFFVIHTKEEISDEDFDIIQRFANVFEQTYTRFRDLENAEYQNKIIQAENERKTKELEEARKLQLAMLPKELPQRPHLDIAVYMQTATEVGGDYYDFSIKEDGSLNIAIGDATGHGMKAGIMVSSMKSIFTTNASKMNIEDFFSTANKGVKSMKLPRMMMGFAMLNIHKDKFQLINAGMPPVFLFQKNSGEVEEISEHGMPIGAMSHSQYNVNEQALEKGDTLLLMSDGLPELLNENEEMYGYKRIRNGFEDVAEKAPEEIISFLKNEGKKWNGDQAPDDDVTFVVIKVK